MDKSSIVRRQAVWAAKESIIQIAVSRSVQDTIAHFTQEPEKIRVIPCGVDGMIFTPLENGRRRDPNQILFVGFINFNKGIDVLLAAMRRVIAHQPEAKLVVVGGGFFHNTKVQEQRLRQMAQDLEASGHVQFVGHKQPAEVARYMRESSMLVLPSRAESFGAVLVEALACGTPIVATKCGGPEDIINDKVGVLVAKEDPDALAEVIERVLEQQNDYHSTQLREYALQNFSWERIARQMLRVYQEAIDLFQARKVQPPSC